MPSVSFSYDVNQVVWTIDKMYGVRRAIIKAVTFDSNVVNVSAVVNYDVQYIITASPSQVLTEDKVFGDIDLAMNAYKQLIISCCS